MGGETVRCSICSLQLHFPIFSASPNATWRCLASYSVTALISVRHRAHSQVLPGQGLGALPAGHDALDPGCSLSLPSAKPTARRENAVSDLRTARKQNAFHTTSGVLWPFTMSSSYAWGPQATATVLHANRTNKRRKVFARITSSARLRS